MITKESFALEHIEEMAKKLNVDKQYVEKNIFALSLVETLRDVKLDFVFKGGTSLTLLLDTFQRLSTDVDIAVPTDTDLNHYINEAEKHFPFRHSEIDARPARNGILKRHFKFYYDSPIGIRDNYILLDVLFQDHVYSKTIDKRIDNSLLLTKEPYITLKLPTIDSLLGDKLTAFAPHTIGVPMFDDRRVSVCKQFYDVASLFDKFENSEDVINAYYEIAAVEITYHSRDDGNSIEPEEALKDTIEVALTIASRGMINKHYYDYFLLGLNGLRPIVRGGRYNFEMAVLPACKIIYLAACVLNKCEIERVDKPDDYRNFNISQTKYGKLQAIRKADRLGFAYLVKAMLLLDKDHVSIKK